MYEARRTSLFTSSRWAPFSSSSSSSCSALQSSLLFLVNRPPIFLKVPPPSSILTSYFHFIYRFFFFFLGACSFCSQGHLGSLEYQDMERVCRPLHAECSVERRGRQPESPLRLLGLRRRLLPHHPLVRFLLLIFRTICSNEIVLILTSKSIAL